MNKRILSVLAVCSFLVLPGTRSAVDDGDWVFVGAPLGDTALRDMLVDPANEDLWYVGSQDSGLYVTRDAGGTWEQHLDGTVGAIAIDPAEPDVVYAGSGSDLYRSDDRGATWDLRFAFPNPIPGPVRDAPTFIDSILVSAVDGTLVVGLTATFHSARVYTSGDDGATWDISFEAPNGFHFWDLAEIAGDGTWFFCTEDPSHIASPVVMRSADRGLSWEEMTAVSGSHGLNLDVHPWTQAVYFLTESGVLYSSPDAGDTWSGPQFLEFGSVLLIDPVRPERFFGGEFVRGIKVGGVYASEDTGASYEFIGLTDRTIGSLALNGTSTKLFAVAPGYGIYVLNLGGATLSVDVDVKPGSDANSINPRGSGVIPVALLGGEDLDVRDVDVATLFFGPAEAAPAHDLSDPWTYNEHLADVDLDGFVDLVTHFRTRETGIVCGDGEATVHGATLDGTAFQASDGIRTVGCPPPE